MMLGLLRSEVFVGAHVHWRHGNKVFKQTRIYFLFLTEIQMLPSANLTAIDKVSFMTNTFLFNQLIVRGINYCIKCF